MMLEAALWNISWGLMGLPGEMKFKKEEKKRFYKDVGFWVFGFQHRLQKINNGRTNTLLKYF